jgi:hypothetical protein
MRDQNNHQQKDRGCSWFERTFTEQERQSKSEGATRQDDEQRL